jgi:hypothetical protein
LKSGKVEKEILTHIGLLEKEGKKLKNFKTVDFKNKVEIKQYIYKTL